MTNAGTPLPGGSAGPCPHVSWTGDEGPAVLLGREVRRWKCDSCGAARLDVYEGPLLAFLQAFDEWRSYPAGIVNEDYARALMVEMFNRRDALDG